MDESQKSGQQEQPDQAHQNVSQGQPKENQASQPDNGGAEGAGEQAGTAEEKAEPQLPDLTVQRLKDMQNAFRAKMRLQQEPVAEFRVVLEAIEAVATDQARVFEGKPDAEEHFFKAFLTVVLKALTSLIKSVLTKEEFREMVGRVPGLLARVLFNNLGNVELHDSLKCIFDHKSRLYQNHFQSAENAILTQSSALREALSEEERSWREALKEGSQIEALKVDPDLQCKCWATCIVQSVSKDKVRVKFVEESKTCDRNIELWGPEIAPCGERSKADDEFRANLAIGQRVDCFDGTRLWYAATISAREVREFQKESLKHVHIAFRVPHPDGDRTDNAGNKYFGWPEEFDEWIPERSSRIAPYKTYTTESLENQTQAAQNAVPDKKGSDDVKSNVVDDTMDEMLDQVEGQRIFAVQRKQCRSDLLIDFLNDFGRLGGFENLLKRLQDCGEECNGDAELVYVGNVIENIAKCAPVLHRGVVNQYFEEFESAAMKKIIGATNRQHRNTGKETTDGIVENLYKEMLPRLASRDAVGLTCDRHMAVLDMGLLFLSQDFLGRRVDGVKLINDVSFTCLRAFQQPPSGAAVTATQTADHERKLQMTDQAVGKLMKEDYVLKELFSKERTHTQLVQRTEQLLRLLMAKEQLNAEKRQLVWQAGLINDGDMKIDLYKVLHGAAADMLPADRAFFLEKLLSIPRNEVIDREVELVSEICTARGRADCEEIAMKGVEYMWETVLESGDGVPTPVMNRALMGLSEILKGRPMDVKIEYADRLAERARDGRHGFLVLKIFARFLKVGFEGATGHPEITNLSDMIEYLEKKHHLLDTFFQSLVEYMSCVAKELESGREDLKKDPEKKVIQGLYAHSDQITQRLDFIKFYAQSSDAVSVSAENLNVLWEELGLKSAMDADKKQIYEWLREVCDGFLKEQQKQGQAFDPTKSGQGLVTLQDLMGFYKEKLLRSEDEDVYKDLSLAGFHCIQSFFVLLNGISGKLVRITDNYGQYKGKHLVKREDKTAAKAASTTADVAVSQMPATTTAIGYDASTGKMTSYSSTGGAEYGQFSWQSKGTTTSTSTGTTTYGPQPKPDAAKGKNEVDPEDLAILVLVPPNELEGYAIIWRLATESKGKYIIEAAAKFLVQMHHNVSQALESRIAEFDDMYIAQCFEIANRQKPPIRARTAEETAAIQARIAALPQYAGQVAMFGARPVQERRIIRSLFLLRQLIRWSERGGTHDLRAHDSLTNKGTLLNCIQVQNNVTHSSKDEYRQRIEISISDQATLWDLKKRIGVELASRTLDDGKTYALHPGPDGQPTPPVHPAAIRLVQMSSTSEVSDPGNGMTLKELKFKANEQLGAYRLTPHHYRREGPIVVDNEETDQPELSKEAHRALGEVFEQYSTPIESLGGVRMMTKALCVEFTAKVTDGRSSADDPRVTDLMDKYCTDKEAEEKLVGLDGLKRFCVDACVGGKEESLRGNFRRLGYSRDLRRLPRDGEPENIEQPRRGKEEMPRYKVALNEHYFDSLIDLLELDPEVASRARDTIAILATQPVLYSTVSRLEFSAKSASSEADESGAAPGFDWSSIFDARNVHKMLYSLEIVAAILAGYTEGEHTPQEVVAAMASWVKRFLELRGLQELQRQLSAALLKVESENKNDDKKLADRLLQLIRMFLTTATKPEEEDAQEAEKVQEQAEPEPKKAPAVTIPQAPADSSKEAAPVPGGYRTPTKKKLPIRRPAAGDDAPFEEITQAALFGDDAADTRNDDEEKKAEESEAKKPEEKAASEDSLRYLRQVMKIDGLGDEVLKLVDARGLQEQMTKLVDLLLAGEFQREDRMLVDSALGLWAQLVKGAAAQAEKPEIEKPFVLRGLIEAATQVRESFCNNFKELVKDSRVVAEQVFEVLFDQLRNLEDLGEFKNKRGRRTEEFFGLLTTLIPIVGENNPELLLELLKVAIQDSMLHNSTEESGESHIDSTRVGLFKVMAAILGLLKKEDVPRRQALDIVDQARLIEHIHRGCLFYYGNNQEIEPAKIEEAEGEQAGEVPKEPTKRCYTTASREAAYSVLNAYQCCLEPKEMAEYLESYLVPLLKDVARPKKWKHQPSAKGRVHGHCGLINLGCICYMISMVQQFFLVPQFRYQLLKAEDDTPPNLQEYKGDMIDDNLLHQLRRLFGYLELSARRAYDPKPLCFSFKEFDGTPTKIGEQKDSQEFLNIFFDRLETQLKPTSQRHLLRDVFAGNQCTQLICSSCGKVKNRIELFYNLSLQVKGSAGIYDSLSQLAKGQTIEDFNCDFCNQRTNVVRRQLLADTPNTLIVHLQRIVFSFDTLQNDKVNARFEFPTVLDLKDYSFKERMTQEKLDVNEFKAEEDVDLSKLMEIDDDEYLYRLVGVNVHVGTADHGHYYSLIDLKRGAAELDATIKDEEGNTKLAEWADVARDPWKVFDDSTVRQFNFDKDLKAEAFGESPAEAEGGDRKSDAMTDAELASFLASGSKTYGKSAYMLVYERKSKKSLHEIVVVDGQEETKLIEFRDVPKFVPEWIQKEVAEDNKQFHIDAQMFHDDFFGHVKSFFKQIGNDLVMTQHKYDYEYYKYFAQMKQVGLQVGGKVLFDMHAYYERTVALNDFASSLGSLILFCDSAWSLEKGEKSLLVGFVNEYLLADNCQHFFKIMFTCTSLVSRKYAGVVAGQAISRLIKLYHDCKPELRETVDAIKEVKTAYSTVIDLAMVALMEKECHRNASKLAEYFNFLKSIATSSVSAAQHFLERSDAIADLIDFMLGNASPRVVNSTEKRVAMGGATPPPFQPLFSMVSFLIRMIHTPHMELDQRLPTHVDMKLEGDYEAHKSYFLHDEAGVMLTATDWLEKVIFDPKYGHEQNGEFCKAMAHLCYKDLAFSKQLITKLLKAIGGFAADDGLKALLKIVGEVALVKDEFQVQRLEYLFGFGFLMHARDSDGNVVYGRHLQEVRTSLQDTHLVASTLDARTSTDGLINLLWGYRTRFEGRALSCLQHLLELTVADDLVAFFVSQLPAYDYSMARFTDFIRPYLADKMTDNEKYQAASGYQDRQDQLIKLTSILEQYERFLEKQLKDAGIPEESEYIRRPVQPYVILQTGGQESERVVYETVIDETVEVRITQVGAFWITSKPLGKGKGNLSLPEPEKKDEKESKEKEQPKPSTEIADPAVKAQMDSMKESLGMGTDAPTAGDAAQPVQAQIELKEPQDAEMVVDAVVDANPVSKAVPTVQEQYPDCQFSDDLLYRVTLVNKLETNVKVEVEFSVKDENVPVNLSFPVGSMVDYLKPSMTATLMTLAKVNPIGDPVNIDNLQIKVTQSGHSDNDFQMSSFASQSDIPKVGGATGSSSAVPSSIKDQRRNGIIYDSKPDQKTGDVGVGDDDTGRHEMNVGTSDFGGQGQKNCPVCTFLNDMANNVCEICGSPF